MKATQIVLIVAAFVLGAGIMAAVNSGGGDNSDLERQLAEAKERNRALESKLAGPAISAREAEGGDVPEKAAPLTALSPATPDGEETASDPEAQIAKLFNSPEARNLMKGFAGAMSGRSEGWIKGEVDKYKEKLGLTDAQADSIKAKMAAMMKKNTEKFQAALDDGSRPMQEIMESQGDFWRNNNTEIEAMLQDELTEDQYAQFERDQLQEKTERVQRSADSELARMDEALELSETQQDQVFDILVRESPEYDPAMAIEGAETSLPAAATAEGVSKDDAIRSVLSPEQTETYNARAESGGFGRRRGPWGGGRGFGRPR